MIDIKFDEAGDVDVSIMISSIQKVRYNTSAI